MGLTKEDIFSCPIYNQKPQNFQQFRIVHTGVLFSPNLLLVAMLLPLLFFFSFSSTSHMNEFNQMESGIEPFNPPKIYQRFIKMTRTNLVMGKVAHLSTIPVF
jgi:hypothetical protein